MESPSASYLSASEVASDLSASSSTADEQRLRIAADIGLLPDHLPALNGFQAGAADAKLRPVIERILSILDSNDRDKVWELCTFRIYCETLFCLEIANDPRKKDEAVVRMSEIQSRLSKKLSSKDCSTDDLLESWRLDGEFHRCLCEISGHPRLVQVVNSIIDKCQPRGIAKKRRDIERTFQEHEQIKDAILAPSPDEDRILEVVLQHVASAFKHWYPREGKLRDEPQATVERALDLVRARLQKCKSTTSDQVSGACARVRQALISFYEVESGMVSQPACDFFAESLAIQFCFPDEYVIFTDESRELQGALRGLRKVLFHSAEWELVNEFLEQLEPTIRDEVSTEFQPTVLSAVTQ